MFSEIRLSFLSAEEARRVVPDPIRETFSKGPVTTFSEDHRQKFSTVIDRRTDLLAVTFTSQQVEITSAAAKSHSDKRTQDLSLNQGGCVGSPIVVSYKCHGFRWRSDRSIC
jgi:hypothetical protein